MDDTTELIQHEGMYDLVKVTLENGEQLEVTSEYPFYIQGKGWNAAAGLKVGDALLLYNGTIVVVETVDFRMGRARVYNFSVARNANYFVGSGGVGVHNSVCKKYKRPSYSVTDVQRKAVQNNPCVSCGKMTNKQVADHKTPLVVEYYETGAIDKQRMLDVDSVQPQCPECSAKQGAALSQYSRQKKKELGL